MPWLERGAHVERRLTEQAIAPIKRPSPPVGPSGSLAPRRMRPAGFFVPALRLDFLVDGFNVYHSLVEASAELAKKGLPSSTKWLDLKRALTSYLHVARARVGMVDLRSVQYFSALAYHREGRSPGGVADHTRYIDAVRATGVNIELGRFKSAGKKACPKCQFEVERHVEKETDVSIAVRILELFVRDEADVVVVVSGDTDIIPAIKCAKQLFPTKFVGCLFPFNRKNVELMNVCDFHASLSKEIYARSQLPTEVETTAGGRKIRKPADW